ncbi:restriction endonuclease subunit S [Clostridium sp. C8-1-8]|uniref:restriction endonuclease subunit S n=1 Tax=Clostridium sp. C8-1-8 TaxID=2698831 RepID=UPI001367FE78|nr:restriction endonuclease subunit S [Clostridium sp. C8-1-8]
MSFSEWRSYSLKDVCRYSKDKVEICKITQENYISTENMLPEKGGVTLASTIPNSKSVTAYVEGDVLISNIRPYFKKIWFSNNKGGASNDVLVLKCNEKIIYNKYLYYFLSQDKFFDYVMGTSKGTKMPRGDKDAILKYDINLPSLIEQRSIVKILSHLDEKIETNNQINKKLEEMAQTIFKQWFVNFEFPNEDGEPYKSSGGKMVESEMGMIPEGWEFKKLNEILDNVKNSTKSGEHLKDRKYIPIDTMPMKSLTIKEFKSYKEANSSLVLFEEFDILIGAMRVYFHRVNLAPFKGVTRTTTFVLRSKEKSDISYNLCMLNLDETINYADKTSKGTTMPYAIWENGLGDMMVAHPKCDLRNKFNNIVFPILKKMVESANENTELKEVRDILLPKLMSGEIRIPVEVSER